MSFLPPQGEFYYHINDAMSEWAKWFLNIISGALKRAPRFSCTHISVTSLPPSDRPCPEPLTGGSRWKLRTDNTRKSSGEKVIIASLHRYHRNFISSLSWGQTLDHNVHRDFKKQEESVSGFWIHRRTQTFGEWCLNTIFLWNSRQFYTLPIW